MSDYFPDSDLVKMPPIKRAAYSDRTAWLLAEISRLVYDPLPCEESSASLVQEVRAAVVKGEADDMLEALIKKAVKRGVIPDNAVVEALKKADFELLESFAEGGTEAMLAQLKSHEGFDGMLVLAFRGTQPGIKDVLTDIKADLVNADCGGMVHRGFLEAFDKVKQQITDALQLHKGQPLYITGHSLGGALAMLATRMLASDSIGACYTYGCPRTGDDEFFKGIKTPVYRVVNAADGVARVPFGHGFSFFLAVLRAIPINGTYQLSEWLRKNFLRYTHYGNLVFLSDAPNVVGDDGIMFKDLLVKKSPNIFWRFTVVSRRLLKTRLKAAGADHSILDYSQKLLAHARRRNRGCDMGTGD